MRLFTSGPAGEISGSTNEVRSFARSLGRPSSKGRERFALNHLLAHLTKLVGAEVERKGVVEILLGRKRVVEIELGNSPRPWVCRQIASRPFGLGPTCKYFCDSCNSPFERLTPVCAARRYSLAHSLTVARGAISLSMVSLPWIQK